MNPQSSRRAPFKQGAIFYGAVILGFVLSRPAKSAESAPSDPSGQVTDASAAQLYNEGNAHARAGALGAAILDYRRAQLLDPRDRDLRANLAFVRSQVGLKASEAPWSVRAVRLLSLSGWTSSVLATVWLLCAALAAMALSPRRRRLWLGLSVGVAMAAVVAVSGFGLLNVELHSAVVTAKSGVDLRLSPFAEAASEGTLREGESVRADARHGTYLHVRSGEGRQGWVDSRAVEPLIPRAEAASPVGS